jgi:hypothetical protein
LIYTGRAPAATVVGVALSSAAAAMWAGVRWGGLAAAAKLLLRRRGEGLKEE